MRNLLLVAFAVASGPASSQTFECRMGKNAACLDWGETVCMSQGMCVDKNAVCFDSYQCDYNGFACKSEVDERVEAHDKTAQDYNSLADDYEALHKAGQVLSDAYDALQRDFDDLQLEVKDLEEARDDAASCLFLGESLEIAKRCMD